MQPSDEPYRVREIWPPGTVIKGDFSIQRKLGGGGFGTVYLAQHRFLNTTHVIKRLHEQFASDPEYVRKFVTEARAVRRLKDCPNVVEVEHMTQSEDGHLILVMEHIPGGDLSTLMESRPLSVDEVIEYSRQIALGLAAAHAAGLVHRDIKPQNIMISHNSTGKMVLKLIDFGIVADHLSQQQTSIMHGGSIGYAAPEQWVKSGKDLDGRTDLYALGASMYRMLCGRMPFASNDIGSWIEQVKQGPPVPPALLRADVPQALSDLILELLAVHPEYRPPNAAAVIRRLDAISGSAVKLYPPTVDEVRPKTILRDPVAARPSHPPTRPSSDPSSNDRPWEQRQPPDWRPTQPEPPQPPAPQTPTPRPKWHLWSGVAAFAAVLSVTAWFAVGNKDQPVQPAKHDEAPPTVVTNPPITTKKIEPPKPQSEPEQKEKPDQKDSRQEPASSRQQPTSAETKPQEPIRQQAPPPEPAIDHAVLGDNALNTGDFRAALTHYKALNDPARLARLQRAVESDADERVTGMLDKGQYANALRLVDGWSADFPGSQRLRTLHNKIVYARDHQ